VRLERDIDAGPPQRRGAGPRHWPSPEARSGTPALALPRGEERDPGTGRWPSPEARSGTPALALLRGVERDPGTGRWPSPEVRSGTPALALLRGVERDPGTGHWPSPEARSGTRHWPSSEAWSGTPALAAASYPGASPATELQSVSRASQRGLQHHPLVGERASYFTFLLRVVSLNSEIPAGHQGSRARPRSTGTLYKPPDWACPPRLPHPASAGQAVVTPESLPPCFRNSVWAPEMPPGPPAPPAPVPNRRTQRQGRREHKSSVQEDYKPNVSTSLRTTDHRTAPAGTKLFHKLTKKAPSFPLCPHRVNDATRKALSWTRISQTQRSPM